MASAAVVAQKARSVAVVYHDHGVVFVSQITHAFQVGNNAVHGEHAVGGDQNKARAVGSGLLKLFF